ncbi:hypothetical protein PR202_gb15535 [Eleusine coracana subsp. coracana]|uniref:SAM-dependent methyltransferase RsmB-F/NOP2-type catalytic core domain-containing protein n=1 Tax=Eleusine coracana subsp. coracana TaxID=191504 RepID=A0AAV5EZ73_ELECO|nr:hypothetical protein PR202_gb15535 [Eleusine coracana subsp. coracana]
MQRIVGEEECLLEPEPTYQQSNTKISQLSEFYFASSRRFFEDIRSKFESVFRRYLECEVDFLVLKEFHLAMVPPLFLNVQHEHHILDSHSLFSLFRNSGMGNERHRLQVDIAMRGIELLKVGGRMVYSTCSMNPVENEAVVAELLRRNGNCIELLDVSNELPELVRRLGLITWKVQDRGSWFETYEDLPNDRKNGILPSMFPPNTKESHTICGKVEQEHSSSVQHL